MLDPDYVAGRAGWTFPPGGDWAKFQAGQASREGSQGGAGLLLMAIGVAVLAAVFWLIPIWLPALLAALASIALNRSARSATSLQRLTAAYFLLGLTALAIAAFCYSFINAQRQRFFEDDWYNQRIGSSDAVIPDFREISALGQLASSDHAAWLLIAAPAGLFILLVSRLLMPDVKAAPSSARNRLALLNGTVFFLLLAGSLLGAGFLAEQYGGFGDLGLYQFDPIALPAAAPSSPGTVNVS